MLEIAKGCVGRIKAKKQGCNDRNIGLIANSLQEIVNEASIAAQNQKT
jgi:hypothetical protein